MPLTLRQQWSVYDETQLKKELSVHNHDPDLVRVAKNAFYFGAFFMLNTMQELAGSAQSEEWLKKQLAAYEEEVLNYAQVSDQDRHVQ